MKPSYLIIGDGRVARHFGHYLSLLEIPFREWSRSAIGSESLAAAIQASTHVLLLISDSAIESFIFEHPTLRDKCCVHFSGSVVTEYAYSAHPLMTFGSELYDLEVYQEIPWTIEAGEWSFSELLPGLPNPSFSIDKQQKPYYHALVVMANNFTTLLWSKCMGEMKTRFGIPNEGLIPILKKTMIHIAKDAEDALTGPLIRQDHVTINKNLEALQGDPFQGIYQAFVEIYKENR